MHFGVIGTGEVGLNTALILQNEYPTANITIVNDTIKTESASNSKTHLFIPAANLPGPSEQITSEWITQSFAYWDALRMTSESSLAGVAQMSAYVFASSNETMVQINPNLASLLLLYRSCSGDELKICPGNWNVGAFLTTTLTDVRLYRQWATTKFLQAGGIIVEKEVKSLFELGNCYDILLNCSSLRARELCNDTQLIPNREKTLTATAPWIKTAFIGDLDTYIVPSLVAGEVTLGCTQDTNPSTTQHVANTIVERCERMIPSLKTARVVRESIDFRLHRDPIRVESEIIMNHASEKTMKIVHNYGHGADWVSTGPGTAEHAVRLVKALLSSSGLGSKNSILTL